MGSTCNSGLDKTLSTRLKHLRKKNVRYVKSRTMSRNRQNVFTRPTIISNFKSPKSLKERDVHHRSLDCASSLDFYSDSTRCFLVMTEENGNRSSLEDFRPISKISHQICVTYFLIRTWSLHWLCNLSNNFWNATRSCLKITIVSLTNRHTFVDLHVV